MSLRITWASVKWDFDELANKWDNNLLAEMGMDIWQTNDTDIDSFFTDAEEKEKTNELYVTVHIPMELGTEIDEIRAVVEAAVAEYKGVTVK